MKDGLNSACKACACDASREWRCANKEVAARANKAWSQANPEKRNSINKAWRDENKEQTAITKKAWAENNPEIKYAADSRWRENNKERIAVNCKAWNKANPERKAALERNRRARVNSSQGSHTSADIIAILASQRGLCATCEAKLFKSGKQKYHVDHIMPISRGGTGDKYNLQCLCPACNLRKSAKHPCDWAKINGKLL